MRNSRRDPQAVEPLIEALADRKALVRGHAAWALGRLRDVCAGELLACAKAALLELQAREPDAWVREEIVLALERFGDEAQESA